MQKNIEKQLQKNINLQFNVAGSLRRTVTSTGCSMITGALSWLSLKIGLNRLKTSIVVNRMVDFIADRRWLSWLVDCLRNWSLCWLCWILVLLLLVIHLSSVDHHEYIVVLVGHVVVIFRCM